MTDLSGSIQSPPGGTNFNPTGTDTSVPIQPTRQQVTGFEDGDTIGSVLSALGDITGFQFNQSSSTPGLIPPQEDANAHTTPRPMSFVERAHIKQEFQSTLVSSINTAISTASPPLTEKQIQALNHALESGVTPIPGSPERAIYQQCMASTTLIIQAEYGLPSKWTPESHIRSDWTPAPSSRTYSPANQATINADYQTELETQINSAIANASPPLTEEQVVMLRTAVEQGAPTPGDPEIISDMYTAATSKATTNIQIKFNLPDAWLPNSSISSDWKTESAASIGAPQITGEIHASTILKNGQIIAELVAAAAATTLSSLPAGSAHSVILGDFLKAIASAIDELKGSLRNLQAKDAQIKQALTAAKFSELGGRRELGKERERLDAEQLQKAIDARNKSNKTAGIMKILGPIVAAVCCVIGAICCIAAGAGTAIIAAGIAVGIAMTAYSVADGQLGLTQKMAVAFKAFLEKLGPVGEAFFIIAIAVVVVVIIALLAAASGGSSLVPAIDAAITASIETASVGTQMAIQATAMAVKQLTITLSFMLFMGSGLIHDLLSHCKLSDRNLMIVEACVTIVFTILMAAAAAKTGNPAQSAAQAAEKTTEEVATKTVSAISQRIDAAIKEAKEALNKFLQSVDDLTDGVLGSAAKSFKEGVESIKKTVEESFQKVEEMLSGFANFFEGKEGLLLGTARGLNLLAQAAPLGVKMYGDIVQGIAMKEIAHLLKEIGEVQAAEEVLQELIKMLTKLMDKITEAMTGPAEDIGKLVDFVMKIFDKANASLTKVDNAGIPG